jgi:hypothetical protein
MGGSTNYRIPLRDIGKEGCGVWSRTYKLEAVDS